MSHLKRLAAPKSWNISRKERKFTVSTRPGPHAKEQSVPLVVFIRDLLGLVKSAKEAKTVLLQGAVLVNGKKRRDLRFSVGLMDIVEFPLMKTAYMISINRKGKLFPAPVENAKERMCRVEGKTIISNGKVQLNLFGSENIIVDKDEYKRGDVVKLSISDNKIKGNIVLSNDTPALIIGGSHVGKTATIKGIDKSITPTEIILEDDGKNEIRTRLYNVYPIEQS